HRQDTLIQRPRSCNTETGTRRRARGHRATLEGAMAKDYQCPACKNAVDRSAAVCSNPECRKSLAFCSHCRDVTTYSLVERHPERFRRDRFRCDRCERIGCKCLTWLAGGYCN